MQTKKEKKTQKIDVINEIKNSAAKKNAKITAKKFVQKYKSMKRPKKTYLVNEEEIETINYDKPREDLFNGESVIEAANKVLDFDAFKKDQEKTLKDFNKKAKKSTLITAKKISQKYKNLKKIKKTYLVNEEDLETIACDEPQEDLFKGESIVKAANKVLDFDAFKKEQETAINNFNKNRRKEKEEVKIADIIKLPKKKKTSKRQSSTNSSKKKYRKSTKTLDFVDG